MSRKSKRYLLPGLAALALIGLLYFIFFRGPAYFLIGITNQSQNLFIKEVKFKNRGTGVNERIAGSIGNIRGPFPAKMTVVSQAKDGSIREQDFEVARHAPWNCHTLEIRVMEDDVVRLLFVTYSDSGDGPGIDFYDPLAPKSEAQRVELETQMCEAAKKGDTETIQKLLDAGVSPNARIFGAYVPALQWAAGEGHPDVVKLLLSRGAKVENAIIRAAEKLDPEILELMVKQGGDVNLVFEYKTPLIYAIRANKDENVRWLVAHGADANFTGDYRRVSPLICAAAHNPEVIPLLLDNGADPLIKDETDERTVLEKAIQWRKECPDFKPDEQKELDFAIEVLRKAEAKAKKPEVKKETPPSPSTPSEAKP